MRPIAYKRHRFPPDMIRHAVWLYFRCTLSICDIGELLTHQGVEVSREAVRCWVNKLGPLIAANLCRHRGAPTGRWHLDEMVVKISGKRMFFWRAFDDDVTPDTLGRRGACVSPGTARPGRGRR